MRIELLAKDLGVTRGGFYWHFAADVEARSVLAFSLAIGNHFIAADHGALTRRQVVDAALKRILA